MDEAAMGLPLRCKKREQSTSERKNALFFSQQACTKRLLPFLLEDFRILLPLHLLLLWLLHAEGGSTQKGEEKEERRGPEIALFFLQLKCIIHIALFFSQQKNIALIFLQRSSTVISLSYDTET